MNQHSQVRRFPHPVTDILPDTTLYQLEGQSADFLVNVGKDCCRSFGVQTDFP